MSVDLNKAERGSKMRLRCGGEIDWPFGSYQSTSWNLHGLSYRADGSIINRSGKDICEHPFDIISITPPAFDWATVKAGMAFLTKPPVEIKDDLVRIFVGECRGQWVFFCPKRKDRKFIDLTTDYVRNEFMRSPQHDEVQS